MFGKSAARYSSLKPLILINGNESDQIPAADRGFQYGDGLFETLTVENGTPIFLVRHLDRLREGCERLGIKFPGKNVLSEEVLQLCKTSESAILKVIVTRGPGGRGYRLPEKSHSTRVVSLHPKSDRQSDFEASGVRVVTCKSRLGINPALAGLKHLNRLEQILARAEWDDPEIQEGLMLDSDRNVIEGTMSNLFIVKRNTLLTPDLSRCGVNGIIRSVVLEIARQNQLENQIARIVIDDIKAADEVFMTNSVIGLWPVAAFEQVDYEVGPVTRKIMQCLEERKK